VSGEPLECAEDGAVARAAEEAKRAEDERKAIADAQKIVPSGMRVRLAGEPCGSTRRSALRLQPDFPWLTYLCPGCRMVGSVDLRDR